MKRLSAIIIACALIMGAGASCSSDDAGSSAVSRPVTDTPLLVDTDENDPVQTDAPRSGMETDVPESSDIPQDTSSAPGTDVQESTEQSETYAPEQTTDTPQQAGGDITGNWLISESGGLGVGIGFSEGNGSVFVDFSEQMHFDRDGFVVGDKTITDVDYDGTVLTVSDLMVLKRTGPLDFTTCDGEYTLESGTLYDSLVTTIGEQFGVESSDTKVYFGIDGETFYMRFDDMFSYTVSGNMLAMKGNVRVLGDEAGNGSYAEFEINGSSMSFLTNSGDLISLSRWEA